MRITRQQAETVLAELNRQLTLSQAHLVGGVAQRGYSDKDLDLLILPAGRSATPESLGDFDPMGDAFDGEALDQEVREALSRLGAEWLCAAGLGGEDTQSSDWYQWDEVLLDIFWPFELNLALLGLRGAQAKEELLAEFDLEPA